MRHAFPIAAVVLVVGLTHAGPAARADDPPPAQAAAPQQQSAVTLKVDGMS